MPHSAVHQAPEAVEEAVERVRQVSNEPVRAVFMARVLNALTRLARDVEPRVLGNAASESSDYAVLANVLMQPQAIEALREDDPLAEARLAGLHSRELLLRAEGGVVTADQAARLLAITRQAVDRRRRTGKIIGLTPGRRGYLYPVWQFSAGGVLPGLEDALGALEVYGPWMQTAWFINPNSRLDGETPLAMLRRGHTALVVEAARLYGEPGE